MIIYLKIYVYFLVINLLFFSFGVQAMERQVLLNESFENIRTDQILKRWNKSVLQRGDAKIISYGDDKKNRAIYFQAAPKRDSQVGKSHLTQMLEGVKVGEIIEISFKLYIPKTYPVNSIQILDLECHGCGLPKGPGVRLYLRDGQLRIDRSKINIKEPLYPTINHNLSAGKWHKIDAIFRLGHGKRGGNQVFLNNQLVLDVDGTNVIHRKMLPSFIRWMVKKVEIDRLQIGITANSNNESAAMVIDDIIVVKR